MASTYLDDILAWHRHRAANDERPWRDRLDESVGSRPSFRGALARNPGDPLTVIAELKRRSPSKGWLNADLDVLAMATLYESSGASAVSVLTDTEFFAGSLDDLSRVANHVNLPLLRKDFTVSENDVLDARDAGASAVLLIVTALKDHELVALSEVARLVGLDVLVEVHDHDEARRALDVGATLIGVNQRNLSSFEVNPRHAATVVELVRHPEVLCVCESALRSVDDVQHAADAGFDAVLVGEAFVTSPDPASTVRAFRAVRPSS